MLIRTIALAWFAVFEDSWHFWRRAAVVRLFLLAAIPVDRRGPDC
jgi:hypothetical protein